jgi:hypothetical protein
LEALMASHPYISGPNNITQMVNQLRKSFPAVVNSDTVKKYQIAPNNESYVINALQFLGIVDGDGKKTPAASDAFSKHDDEEFQNAFAELVKSSYSELFDLHGDGAWQLDRNRLIGYFRQADKTSEVIGTRQASVFSVFAALSGKASEGNGNQKSSAKSTNSAKPKAATASSKSGQPAKASPAAKIVNPINVSGDQQSGGVTLNVRIEVNLPPGADAETYDAIFSSIRKNLMNG